MNHFPRVYLNVLWELSDEYVCSDPPILSYADDTTLMAESEEELKSLLKVKRGEWKSWLKAQHSEN